MDDHDIHCHSKLKELRDEIKKWCSEKICDTVKPTKVKQTILWAILLLFIGSSSAAILKSWAQDAHIEHNTEKIDEISKQHRDLTSDVTEIKKDVGDIKGYMKQQTQILRALGREHGINVDLE